MTFLIDPITVNHLLLAIVQSFVSRALLVYFTSFKMMMCGRTSSYFKYKILHVTTN